VATIIAVIIAVVSWVALRERKAPAAAREVADREVADREVAERAPAEELCCAECG